MHENFNHLRCYYDLSANSVISSFLPGLHLFTNTFFKHFQKLLADFLETFFIQIANFILHNILNFQILNSKIVLVTNFFLNIDRRYVFNF